MAFITLKLLATWFHNLIILWLFYFFGWYQKMVTVVDWDYYRDRTTFFLFATYAVAMFIYYLLKIEILNIERKTKEEHLKAKKELRKYIENKKKKNDEKI